jgi:hypothetical protein
MTDPEISNLERLALVRDRSKRIREIRQELEPTGVTDSIGQDSVGANREPGQAPIQPIERRG